MPGIHGAQIEEFHDRPGFLQLGCVVGRWGELFEDLPAYTSRRLLLFHHRAVTKVALDKQLHLLIPDEDLTATDIVEPALHERFYADLILLRPGASRCQGGRHGRHNSLRVG